MSKKTAEVDRLEASRMQTGAWKKWGPYLSERQWGTVREDYSEMVMPGIFSPHEHARSRAYRWGEDGLAGISDDKHAPLLRAGFLERQGSDSQGATLRFDQQRGQPRRGCEGILLLPRQHADALVYEILYKYPQAAYPYADLVETNRRRTKDDMEYELLDTGVSQRRPLL